NRRLLVESVDWSDIAPKLDSLPQAGSVASASDLKDRVTKGRQVRATRMAAKKSKPMRVASAPYRAKGFLWDYVAVTTTGTDYTFNTGVTYVINTSGYFSGTLTFNPGCVIKFATNAYLLTYGAILCTGTTNSYSILTSKDDDLYGEPLPGST